MKKVIVFGDLPIATKIVQFLETLDDVEIGIVIGNNNPHNNDPWEDTPLLFDYAIQKNIPMYSLENLICSYSTNELTLGLSCRFSKIIKKNVIDLFKNGIINMHGGLLPEFAGLCSVNHTIIQNSPVGGGTLHYIDEGIDTGNIIKRCEFKLSDTDTAYSVFQKTQIELEKNLEEIIPKALNGIVESKSMTEYIKEGHESHYYNKKDLEKFRCIEKMDLNDKNFQRMIRAFDFPGYEPAYVIDGSGNKLYLRYTQY